MRNKNEAKSLLFVDNNFPDGPTFEAETWVPTEDGDMVPMVDIFCPAFYYAPLWLA